MDGLVIRWRYTPEGPAVVSASRNGVMIHGDVAFNEVTQAWIADAQIARDHLVAGRRALAKAMATHEYDRPFFGDLVPIKKDNPDG